MRKLVIVALVILALTVVMVPVVLAYTPVQGCVVDYYGDPWTHGGTVVALTHAGPPPPRAEMPMLPGIPVGSGELDEYGCFDVPIGNGPHVWVVIDPSPGPEGDPGELYCSVPRDRDVPPEAWDCGTLSTGTGPNAISLSGLGASTGALPWLVTAMGLAALAGAGILVWRRSQLAA
jgi:hypothetical protein